MTKPALQFEIRPTSGVPIYRQIMDQVSAMIGSGTLPAGSLLPSVRQMAADLEINMMTVSKAYAKLEADGLLERQRGRGMRVAQTPVTGSVSQRQAELRERIEAVITRGQQLGLTDAQILTAVKQVLQERQK